MDNKKHADEDNVHLDLLKIKVKDNKLCLLSSEAIPPWI